MDEKLVALWASAKAKISEVWSKNKILFFIIIPLIILVKFRDILIQLIVSSAKRLMKETREKDAQLRNEANAANQQANDLVKKADAADDNKPPVDEDWHKK